MLMVFGDLIPPDARWPKIRQNDLDYADAVRAAKSISLIFPRPVSRQFAHADEDKNPDGVANVIWSWLLRKGFAD